MPDIFEPMVLRENAAPEAVAPKADEFDLNLVPQNFREVFVSLVKVDKPILPFVLKDESHIQQLYIQGINETFSDDRAFYANKIRCVFAEKRINDIRYINKFLEAVNEYLPIGGLFIGSVQTASLRRQAQEKQMGETVANVYQYFDYLMHRLVPKIPYVKSLYFSITKGRNRAITEMETYGRLFSCGFSLVNKFVDDGVLYFAVRKVKQAEYNCQATYGPIITLHRCGKNKKAIKVYKFRTMYPYSEYLQTFMYENQGLQEGGKIKDDPRINSVGRLCRKYWLDEIPMLYNLLRGDIKIVGVRPLSAHYLSLYPKAFQDFRNRFKPGLLPPYYADLPKTLDEIIASEERYLKAYEKSGILTDLKYLYKIIYNIVFRGSRSH